MTDSLAAQYRERTSRELGLAGNHYDAIQAHLDQYEKAIARELAQKIRDHDYDPGEVGPLHLAYLAAADLIDPDKP